MPPPLAHAHHAPPPGVRHCHKLHQKATIAGLGADARVLCFPDLSEKHRKRLAVVERIPRQRIKNIFKEFRGGKTKTVAETTAGDESNKDSEDDVLVYGHSAVAGLRIIPSLLPPEIQITLLSRLLSRDLSNPLHNTNLNAHYRLPHPETGSSFFDLAPETLIEPLDTTTHNPLRVDKMLEKKLRWMTLGGQYDWTKKEYPEKERGEEVDFPEDIAKMINQIFPSTTPQAAIANFYSPGDTLSPHRDISESSSAGLVSLSIGCDAIFLVALDHSQIPESEPEPEVLIMRVKSGDAILMDGQSRWAWHSVPKVIAGTCPAWLESWPAEGYEERWRGWMRGKRVNLNVRQMWD